MARIQVLQLPPYGRDGHDRFALIVDQCETPPQRIVTGLPADPDAIRSFGVQYVPTEPAVFSDEWTRFGQQIGAAGVLVTAERVDIAGEEPSGDVPIEFDHAALLDTISTAVRAHLESAAASDAFRADVQRRSGGEARSA
ncbi:hypothetical protein ABZY58_11710 [Micromonospora tulbaghiae]|uniref:hypothetical protein n=1 Tax=Micromonospora tulbaghiae TaxID=479978 RepID=UPI00339E2ED7